MPSMFGKLSTPHARKWTELFRHACTALGYNDVENDQSCDRAWERVAVTFANLRANMKSRLVVKVFLLRLP